MNPPRFDIVRLSLKRQDLLVLTDVNLTVAPGEIVCLLGPSGGGKSSLLRCLNRLSEPPPETVFVDNEDVTQIEVLALRRRVGMVFQHVALFPGSVAENVSFGPGFLEEGLTAQQIVELLAMVDLPPELADRDSQELSGGQAQRVAIARALAVGPSALLLDEPTSALDPAATRHVESAVFKLRHTLGLTVLWVTHDSEQANRVADRVYLLVDGQVVDEGTPAQLFSPDSKHLSATFAAGELDGK